MTLLTLVRQPVENRKEGRAVLCDARGHCGPFVNEAYYNAFPETLWHGMGDCMECGTTRVVAEHVAHLPTRAAA